MQVFYQSPVTPYVQVANMSFLSSSIMCSCAGPRREQRRSRQDEGVRVEAVQHHRSPSVAEAAVCHAVHAPASAQALTSTSSLTDQDKHRENNQLIGNSSAKRTQLLEKKIRGRKE